MPFKLQRSLRTGIFRILLVLLPASLYSFPDQERKSTSLSGPPLELISSQAGSMLLDGDDLLFLGLGDEIKRVDLETWSLSSDQVPELADNSDEEGGEDLRGDIRGLAIRGDFLYATQSDGDLLVVERAKPKEDPDSIDLGDSSLGPIVADPETASDDDKLYLLDQTANAVLIFDIGDSKVTATIPVKDKSGTSVKPVAAVFAAFPTASSSGSTDKIYVTTDVGLVLMILEGSGTVGQTIEIATTNKELPSLALTPDRNFLLVVNKTDTSVSVISTASDTVVATITLSPNSGLIGIAVADVSDPVDTYAYVTGSGGISVIDLNFGTSSFDGSSVIDFNDEGSEDDEDDPMETTSIPGLIVSSGDGRLYTTNSDASISVISDSPFVTIRSSSVGTGSLKQGESFTLTFQSDETGASPVGSYTVRVGGDLTETGTSVTTGTVDTADTDVTTDAISYNANILQEGLNRIFVFVSDSEGNVGRDALDINVDTPPSAVTIRSVAFGNEKVFVTFLRLDLADLDHYNVYAHPVDASISTLSPGTTVTQPSEGETLTGIITGLDNGVPYFIGVEAVDDSGNIGSRMIATTTVTPEATAGIAEIAGEAGCQLLKGSQDHHGGLFLLTGLVLFFLFRFSFRKGFLSIAFLLVCSSLSAKERSPEWWSFEVKGGAWLPKGAAVTQFIDCCRVTGGAEFGFLWRSIVGLELGAGLMITNSEAVGANSRAASQDLFNFMLIPIQNSIAFRADFVENQVLVPYIKGGPDYVYFRQNRGGNVVQGLKYGLHGGGGIQFLLETIDELSISMEEEFGVNDIYLTAEARYAWINNFGGGGLDLSGWTFMGGLLFEF